jgi:hypothetical protein
MSNSFRTFDEVVAHAAFSGFGHIVALKSELELISSSFCGCLGHPQSNTDAFQAFMRVVLMLDMEVLPARHDLRWGEVKAMQA